MPTIQYGAGNALIIEEPLYYMSSKNTISLSSTMDQIPFSKETPHRLLTWLRLAGPVPIDSIGMLTPTFMVVIITLFTLLPTSLHRRPLVVQDGYMKKPIGITTNKLSGIHLGVANLPICKSSLTLLTKLPSLPYPAAVTNRVAKHYIGGPITLG